MSSASVSWLLCEGPLTNCWGFSAFLKPSNFLFGITFNNRQVLQQYFHKFRCLCHRTCVQIFWRTRPVQLLLSLFTVQISNDISPKLNTISVSVLLCRKCVFSRMLSHFWKFVFRYVQCDKYYLPYMFLCRYACSMEYEEGIITNRKWEMNISCHSHIY